MVLRTSTNGTSATTARHKSGARLALTPMSIPPALPPWMAMLPGDARFSAINPFAAAMKSVKVFIFVIVLPS